MEHSSLPSTTCFIPFNTTTIVNETPLHFPNPFQNNPHPLCLQAALQLQTFLKKPQTWLHNFGLNLKQEGPIIGKMFGVLVVKTTNNEIGFLAAFSGKLAGSYNHTPFVPPLFDSLTENSFLNNGMLELTRINSNINALAEQNKKENEIEIQHLQNLRKSNSMVLQSMLFDEYHFLNQAGETKSLRLIFEQIGYQNPPAGAGDCAGPKLLQYAFKNNLKPLAMSEFWWGQSPKSHQWVHGLFYAACQEKCAPIFKHMLGGIYEFKNLIGSL